MNQTPLLFPILRGYQRDFLLLLSLNQLTLSLGVMLFPPFPFLFSKWFFWVKIRSPALASMARIWTYEFDVAGWDDGYYATFVFDTDNFPTTHPSLFSSLGRNVSFITTSYRLVNEGYQLYIKELATRKDKFAPKFPLITWNKKDRSVTYQQM